MTSVDRKLKTVSQTAVAILSIPGDLHAEAVARCIRRRGHDCTIVDSTWESDQTISTNLDSAGDFRCEFNGIELNASTVVWWRRAFSPGYNQRILTEDTRQFVSREKKFGLHGSIYACSNQIINSPDAEGRANFKPYQLKIAVKQALTIPKTCITNNIDTASEFIASLHKSGKRCICKPLTPPEKQFARTRLVTQQDLLLEELALAPVIFQECVEKGTDIRVCIVGKKIFSAAIVPNEKLMDWRSDPLSKTEHYNLPEDIKGKLFKLNTALGLETGSIDLRVDPDGQFYFFEINPSGQFLWLEADLELPICDAFADLLLETNRPRSQAANATIGTSY